MSYTNQELRRFGQIIGGCFRYSRLDSRVRKQKYAEHLAPCWNLNVQTVIRHIDRIEGGSRLYQRFDEDLAREQRITRDQFASWLSDYRAALNMQYTRSQIALSNIQRLDPDFIWKNSEVEPISRRLERVGNKIVVPGRNPPSELGLSDNEKRLLAKLFLD